MPTEFTVVQQPLSNYQELRKNMSPELQEAFLNACLAANISEDDWIHCLFAFQGELLTAALETQMQAIRTALDGALSVRQSDNKKLSGFLAEYKSALANSGNTIAKQAASFAEQIESLKAEIRYSRDSERQARAGEARTFASQHDELIRTLPDMRKAAESVNEINQTAICWIIGGSLASGAALVILLQHFLFRLF